MKILVADDEASVRMLVAKIAKDEGYELCQANDGEQALEMFEREQPDLVILDVMMPKKNGYQVCEEIRQKNPLVPVIFLSAKSDVVDKCVGFQMGGDDYVVKPFAVEELSMRIDARIRRNKQLSELSTGIVQAGDLILDTKRIKATIGGRPLELTPKEFQLLVLFASNPEKVFTKDQIVEAVWGKEYMGSTTSIAVFIRKIREKIEESPSHPERLQTVWYVGYRYVPKESYQEKEPSFVPYTLTKDNNS